MTMKCAKITNYNCWLKTLPIATHAFERESTRTVDLMEWFIKRVKASGDNVLVRIVTLELDRKGGEGASERQAFNYCVETIRSDPGQQQQHLMDVRNRGDYIEGGWLANRLHRRYYCPSSYTLFSTIDNDLIYGVLGSKRRGGCQVRLLVIPKTTTFKQHRKGRKLYLSEGDQLNFLVE